MKLPEKKLIIAKDRSEYEILGLLYDSKARRKYRTAPRGQWGYRKNQRWLEELLTVGEVRLEIVSRPQTVEQLPLL